MKTQILKTVGAIIITLFTIQFSSAQVWQLGGNPDLFPPGNALFLNSNFFGGSGPTSNVVFGTNGVQYMFMGGPISGTSNGLIGIGNGFSTPAYQLDILASNTVGDGVNVSSGTDAVGYSIGNQMFLWYGINGNNANVFCGVQAGLSNVSSELM
ncbi:MAG TPA: hypothetical protein VK809_08380 [Bacteroidia bacterium]|jgi:hypothetical protein|nr:hypothetical protein [Bacteroidia bacterium]